MIAILHYDQSNFLKKQTNLQDERFYDSLKLNIDMSAKNYSYCSGGYWCGHELLILNIASESSSVAPQMVVKNSK